MLLAIAATFLIPGLQNIGLMALALVIGGGGAWISARRSR
jgi:H+-translocating NAD(P) transhydrogenase subunit beta